MRPFFLFSVIAFFFPLISSATTGTVLDAHKYAWSDNSGYVNFANVIVSDTELSGYAWSANHGWIKFNPAQGGVFNDDSGNLSGYAWGEQLGWINFDNVTINGDGRFRGTATGDLIGTLTFDCTYCDVETDWRISSSAPTTDTSSRKTRTPAAAIPTTTKEYAPESVGMSEKVTTETPVGVVILSVPPAIILSGITFNVRTLLLSPKADYLLTQGIELVNDTIFEITAQDSHGNPVTFFSPPILITLPVPQRMQGTLKLGVYWLNKTNDTWVLIPDAIFGEATVAFSVNHLTTFAIFATPTDLKNAPSIPAQEETEITPSVFGSLKSVLFPLLLTLVSILFLYTKKRGHPGDKP